MAEIWDFISETRAVARATVLNLVDRLEKRGWLKRHKAAGVYRYAAAVDRETTSSQVAAEFVDDFFGGSASELVMSLLGAKRLSGDEFEQLKRLLDETTPRPGAKKGKNP